MRLTEKEYNKILQFYKIKKINKISLSEKKKMSEKILSEKLCRCIKKVEKSRRIRNKSAIIPICKRSVLRRKGLEAKNFTCKKRKSILLKKLQKTTQKNIKSLPPRRNRTSKRKKILEKKAKSI